MCRGVCVCVYVCVYVYAYAAPYAYIQGLWPVGCLSGPGDGLD